jgi:Flp pilus assembly protein protease CpaA
VCVFAGVHVVAFLVFDVKKSAAATSRASSMLTAACRDGYGAAALGYHRHHRVRERVQASLSARSVVMDDRSL